MFSKYDSSLNLFYIKFSNTGLYAAVININKKDVKMDIKLLGGNKYSGIKKSHDCF